MKPNSPHAQSGGMNRKTASLNTPSQVGRQVEKACAVAPGTARTGPNSSFASCAFQNETSAGALPLPFFGTGRKTLDEMSEALDQALAQPLPATSCFYILDKIRRLGQSQRAGVSLADLVPHFRNPAEDLPGRLGARVRKCLDKRYLVRTDSPEGPRFLVTALAIRFVREAKDARIQLWKVNPRAQLDEICAVVDLEEACEEVSAAKAELVEQARRQRLAENTRVLPSHVWPAKGRAVRTAKRTSVWAGLLMAAQPQGAMRASGAAHS